MCCSFMKEILYGISIRVAGERGYDRHRRESLTHLDFRDRAGDVSDGRRLTN
jgi:hypothetical protein